MRWTYLSYLPIDVKQDDQNDNDDDMPDLEGQGKSSEKFEHAKNDCGQLKRRFEIFNLE